MRPVFFLLPMKHRRGFLLFLRAIEKDQWHETGENTSEKTITKKYTMT